MVTICLEVFAYHPAISVTGLFAQEMHEKSQQQHTSTTSRGSSFFIENLLGSCRTEKPVCPIKDNDGTERANALKGYPNAYRKEMCNQASSTGFKTEISPLEWKGRETSESKLRDRLIHCSVHMVKNQVAIMLCFKT